MTIFLVLDILLVLLISLFMPIGWWRGPVKELFVSLGVLFGILLADYWARPWGRDLSDVTNLTSGSGAFVVAWAFLVASTFILGYGIGATLYPAWHSTPARLLGAAIGALNGMLLLSFSLQYVRLFLLSDSNEESLEDSYVAQFLLDGIGWVLLLAAFIALPLLLFVIIDGRRAYEPGYDEYDEYGEYDEAYVAPEPQPRQRIRAANPASTTLPPRVPAAPAAATEGVAVYKSDPTPRQRRPTAETRPLIVSEPQATAEPASSATPSTADRMSDTDPHIIIPAQTDQPSQPTGAEEPAAEPQPEPAVDESGLAPGYTRCINCHTVLAPDVSICPKCGTLK